ncbi:MAG TPA: glycosyltransferase [Lutibacter sp.]
MILPLVSICIPTYNGFLYLNDALESVKEQNYTNIEVIISDDTSKDNTLELVKEFKKKVAFPVNVYHHKPKGIGANWNHCIRKSNGKYIKFLFQDDILLPTCVEDMVNILEANDSVGLVTSKRSFIMDENYTFAGMDEWIENFKDLQRNLNLKFENGLSIIDKGLFKSNEFLRSPLNKIGEPSVIMFRKEVIGKVGYFREDLHQILDYEFCYRILKKQKIAIINKNLVKFRLHAMQATNINRGLNEDTGDTIKYQKILYNEYLRYLNKYNRIHFLKKYNLFYRLYYLIKRKLKI